MVTKVIVTMSGPSQIGVSSDVTSGQNAVIQDLLGLVGTQEKNASTLFNLGLPAEQQALGFEQTLASGDPFAIKRATAPAAQQITDAANSANQNIIANAPAGGEKNLAIEQNQVAAGNEIGKVASQGYLGSFGALGQLGAQNIGQSQGAVSSSLSGLGAGLTGYGQMGSQELQSQQLQLQQKGEQLGFIGQLAGAASQGAGLAVACWCAAESFDGWFDPRTVVVRRWINEVLPQSWMGAKVYRFYVRHGRAVAVASRTNKTLLRVLRVVFNRVLVVARRHYHGDAK